MAAIARILNHMGIDIADLVERARHGMFAAGLVPKDFLGALEEKENSTGSPYGLTTAQFKDMCDFRPGHEVRC